MKDLCEKDLSSGMLFQSWTDEDGWIYVSIGFITLQFNEDDFMDFTDRMCMSVRALEEEDENHRRSL